MPEKWDQVKELFTLALERDPEERSDFLRQACGADDSLRAEIESLLSSFDDAPTFLEDCPAADANGSRTNCGIRENFPALVNGSGSDDAPSGFMWRTRRVECASPFSADDRAASREAL